MGETAREVELKLGFAPGEAARLRHHPALRAVRAGRGHVQRLTATFWDTPDHALAANGIGLRLRREDGRMVQTVKTAGTGAGLYDRPEWNAVVPGEAPDPAALAETPVPATAAPDTLHPVFTTDFVRAAYPVAGDGWTAEAALDLGSIRANGREETIAELEVEGRSGPLRPLFDLAKRLDNDVELTLAPRDKAERGYRLAAGQGPTAEKAPTAALDPAMPAADAFAAAARAALTHVARNAEALRHGLDTAAAGELGDGLERLCWLGDIFAPFLADAESRAIAHRLALVVQKGKARDGDAMRHVAADPAFSSLLLDTARWIEAGAWRGGPG